MSYRMFIDDERFPVEKDRNMMVVRDYDAAITAMNVFGCPDFISFDHDLGEGKNGYDIVKWMVDNDLEHDGKFIPEGFEYYVHSQNPIGKQNIDLLLLRYLSFKEVR